MASSNNNSGNDPKILRIGVIQGGKVIEERLIRKRATVTFGSDNKNTFVFEGENIPKGWALFELKGSNYYLVFDDKMDGRVSVDNNNVDFASLKAQNLVQKHGDRYRLLLNDSSRGRVQFGGKELTILFHFVAAPPVAAKPELPLAAKGGWVKSIEPIFTSVLTGSFLVHALITILVFNVEPPPAPSMDEVKALIARVTPPKIEEPPPPPLPEEPKADKSGDKGKKKKKEEKKDEGEAGKKKKKPGKKSAADKARDAAARREAVRDKISGKGVLGLIGAKGADGALADVFGEGSSVGSLSTDISGTSGVGVAGSGSDITRRGAGGGSGGGAADIGSLEAGGGGAVKTGGKKKAKIKARVKADQIQDLDGEIDKKGVARAIRKRAAAFQQCYETALKTNSKLKGKLTVEFTINERGRVADARVIKDGLGSSEVSKCVLGVLRRLRFPKPSDGEVTITNSFVFQSG